MRDACFDALGMTSHPRIRWEVPSSDAALGATLVVSENPTTRQPLAAVSLDDAASYEQTIAAAAAAFETWRTVPAPQRGVVVRAIAEEFRKHKLALGRVITLEVGKILSEGQGEVQEAVDIADFAVGLSRQLYGMTTHSERPSHRMYEQWLPLGLVGCITAFNFPCAVWAWNAMLAAVCGDITIWKPSLMAPLTAIATQSIADRVATSMGHPNLFPLIIGTDDVIGERLVADRRIPLISATGSCRMGRRIASVVGARMGRTLLELGGNNSVIIDQSADLNLAIPAVVFAAVGTAGQRCTTTRRLIVHESRVDEVVAKLTTAYASLRPRMGDPAREGTLIGPLINQRSVDAYLAAISHARAQGGQLLAGGSASSLPGLSGYFVEPAIIRAPADNNLPISREETFAPIVYIFTFKNLADAVAMNNSVDQGLSSSIFTESVRASETFLSPAGSDCGIANVNVGTSGAEIGGAFGGEKETGGGRESGSDSWKAYMRRQTVTINYGTTVQLAQGINFG